MLQLFVSVKQTMDGICSLTRREAVDKSVFFMFDHIKWLKLFLFNVESNITRLIKLIIASTSSSSFPPVIQE